MRSSIRFGLVAVGTLALLTIGFVTFRARLEPKAGAQVRNGAQAGNAIQVAGCDTAAAPSLPSPGVPGNPCLVISSFRQNGPMGTQDEFVEIFNASSVAVTVGTLSRDPANIPAGINYGIGVFVSAGNGFHPIFGQTANVAQLACNIPGATIIPGRRWYLCGGVTYSLSTLGSNSGGLHSKPDRTIGFVPDFTPPGVSDIPDDAGMALLNIGTNIITQCRIGDLGCPSGFNYPDPGGGGTGSAVVLDKVGFNPPGQGSPMNVGPGLYPGNVYPSLAAQYCEGTLVPSPPGGPTNVAKNLGCLQPIGDASIITLGAGNPCPQQPTPGPGLPFQVIAPNPLYTETGPSTTTQYDTVFPVVDSGFIRRADGSFSGIRKCYGESGQYKIERRRSGGTFADPSGELHKDSYNSMAAVAAVPPALATEGACAQSGSQVVAATICGNNDDYILDAPNPSTNNVGLNYTGVSRVTSILGNAWPHACDNLNPLGGPDNPANCTTLTPNGAPPIVGTGLIAQLPFDVCASVATAVDGKAVIPCTLTQLGPRNAERRYSQDPNILGTNNDPFGTFILRYRFTPSANVTGIRWRLDDLATLCGGQTPTTTVINNPPLPPGTPQSSNGVGTQEARNLRGPDNSIAPAVTPVPSCQGEGSDTPNNVFTSILKGVNHYGEIVVDSSGTARVVAGSVLEDVTDGPPIPPNAPGSLQPFGGGSNSTFVVNTKTVGGNVLNVAPIGPAAIPNIGDGVSDGVGQFARAITANTPFRIAFKFGVVRSGRFKILIGREAFIAAPVAP
jgi:hypothetical protein